MNMPVEPTPSQVWGEVYSTLLVRAGWGTGFFLFGYGWKSNSVEIKLLLAALVILMFAIMLRLEYRRAETRLERIIQAESQRLTIGQLHQSLPVDSWIDLPNWGVRVKRIPDPCESNGGRDA